MSEVAVLAQTIHDLQKNVDNRFEQVHKDLKGLTDVMKQQVKLASEIAHQRQDINRVETRLNEHDKRLRNVEQGDAVNHVRLNLSERARWILFTATVSFLSGLVVYLLTGD